MLLLKKIPFSQGFPFLNHHQVFSCELSLVCRLKYPYSCCFYPFLIRSHHCVVCIVFGRCNYSFFIVFNVLLESLYWCSYTIFNACESSSFFFSCLIVCLYNLSVLRPCVVTNFLDLWFIWLSSSLVYFKNGPEYLIRPGWGQLFSHLMWFQL